MTLKVQLCLNHILYLLPGEDALSFYPLLYWPILPEAPAPSAAAVAALNDFMRQGGIILMDTRDQGSGEGMAAGARAALRRVTRDLAIPPLVPVPEDHVLNRAFYLLNELPGRFAGGQVWVARDQDRANDSVSPVILGGHDWAAAWAMVTWSHSAGATPSGIEVPKKRCSVEIWLASSSRPSSEM